VKKLVPPAGLALRGHEQHEGGREASEGERESGERVESLKEMERPIRGVTRAFFSFFKKCHSGDMKFCSGARNFNIHLHIGYIG